MARPLTIKEILVSIDKTISSNKKRDIVRKYKYNNTFLDLLKGTFNEKIQFHEIETPEYKKNTSPPGTTQSNLALEFRRLYIFQKNNIRSAGIDEYQRNKILIQILESLHEDDAEIFLGVIRKNLKVRGLTKKLVKEVYPELLEEV